MKTLKFLGHSAIFLESHLGTIAAIDPWLEGNPSCPSNEKNPARIDLIVLTHGHSDHAGDTLRLALATGATVIATYELAMILIGEGIVAAQIIPMNKGGTTTFKDLKVSLTNALHSSSYDSPTKGTLYAGEACGVVIQDTKHAVYHAGDTEIFSDMKLIGETYQPDIVCLPIGDRFTMGPERAAKAASLINPRWIVPIHFGADFLPGTAEEFLNASKNLESEVKFLKPGESWQIS
ncbi:MAG TPA: metal-dependent hydrolase [Oligoflexia bacterium]|nr:metal-dependent hydrolase [Oligoflexia bacterium]HMP27500.1 metal-dependent hydrolase [Oligoflexia bacterium]